MNPAAPARTRIHDLSGTELDGRYRLIRLVGAGGMGSVYEGLHIVLGTQIAVKVLKPDLCADEKFHRRFLREARAASAIRSKHVVRATDFGRTADGLVYFVMDLLEGQDLEMVLNATGHMSWPRFRPIALQIIDALRAAHEVTIVHRDIKPANVFLVHRPGEPILVKVLDFGIAKITADGTDGLTGTDEIFGTVSYMAPELAEGATATTQSDMYSLGILMYRALTGRLPFADGTPFQILAKHITAIPIPPRQLVPQLPAEVESTILALLAKKPHDRPSGWNELLERLRAAPDQGPTPAVDPSPPNRFRESDDTEIVPVQTPPDVVTAPALEQPGTSPGLDPKTPPGVPRPWARTGTMPSISVHLPTSPAVIANPGPHADSSPRSRSPKKIGIVSGEIVPDTLPSNPGHPSAIVVPDGSDDFELMIRERRQLALTLGIALLVVLTLGLGVAVWNSMSADDGSDRELLYRAPESAKAATNDEQSEQSEQNEQSVDGRTDDRNAVPETAADPPEPPPRGSAQHAQSQATPSPRDADAPTGSRSVHPRRRRSKHSSTREVTDKSAQASIRREIARQCKLEGSRYIIEGIVNEGRMQQVRLTGFGSDGAEKCALAIVRAEPFPRQALRALKFSL